MAEIEFRSLDFLGFPLHRVGSDGSLWNRLRGDWKLMKPTKTTTNLQAVLQYQGTRKSYILGRLVLLAFRGDGGGAECVHLDGNIVNNKLDNLVWKTPSEIQRSRFVERDISVKDKSLSCSIPESSKSGEVAQKSLEAVFGDTEVWKDISGYEGIYQVSNRGRVKSLSRQRIHMGGVYTIPEKILNVTNRKEGSHRVVGLWKEGRLKNMQPHRLVLEAFVGPCPEGMQCCHNDGNPANNKLENLRWDTGSANQLDRYLHGTAGSRQAKTELSREKVRKIKLLLDTKRHTNSQIADIVGVSFHTVRRVAAGAFWSWLQ